MTLPESSANAHPAADAGGPDAHAGTGGEAGGGAAASAAAASGLDSLQAGLAPEIARRVSSIFDAVEQEAEGLRAEAREEARRYLEDAQRRADDLVRRRQQRIAALSDELLAKAEAVAGRLDSAAPVREGFESLVRALGGAAERLSGELTGPPAPPDHRAEAAAHAGGAPGAGGGNGSAAGTPEPGGGDGPAGASAGDHRQAAAGGAPQAGREEQGPAGFAGADTLAEHWSDPEAARLGAIEMATAGATRGEVRAWLEQRADADDTAAVLDRIFGAAGDHERVPWTAFPG